MPRHNSRSVASFLSGPHPGAEQGLLFESPLSERMDRWPEVAALKALVREGLGDRLEGMASRSGGYGHDPAGLFLALMYGLLKGVRSSRSLEEACCCDLRYRFLTDGLEPDHATLARFRRRLGPELEGLFAEACRLAEERGVLQRRTMVVDGTKVAAVRSQWRKALAEAEATDALEEAAASMLSRGEWLVGYNLQVAADPDSGLLVGYVASANPADQTQMPAVAAAVERQSEGLPGAAVADRGYDSGGNAQALADKGVRGFLPPTRPERAPFAVDKEGTPVCPAGHRASLVGEKRDQRGRPRLSYRVFRCGGCPLKKACGVKGSRRELTVARGEDARSRPEANARCGTEEGRALLRLRGPTIERVFAQMKWNLGFRRLLLRGLEGATLELGLFALSRNLRLLARAAKPA